MKKEKCYKKELSCRKVFIRHLRIFVSDGMVNEREEIRRSRITNFRDDKSLCYNGKAFTLIELLVVVLIIGILAAVAVPQYQKAVIKSRFAAVKAAAKALADAEKLYYLANGTYTTSLEELSIDISGDEHVILPGTEGINFPWGNCYVGCGGDCGGCTLKKNDQAKITYFYYWNSNVRRCLVYDGAEQVYTDVCKAETGNTTGEKAGSGYTYYNY